MHLFKKNFYRFERILNSLGLYDIILKLIDLKIIKNKHYKSDLYKFSTTYTLIKNFYGYIGHETDYKKGHLGFGLLHHAFITINKPEKILCIGSQQGFIPAICATACRENNYGHVDFVDAGKYKNENNSWGGIGFWKKNNPHKHFAIFNLNKYITSYIMTSKQFANKYKKRKYEYIYIDGDHSYKGIKYDFKTFWPRLAENGIMAFHDIHLKGLSQGKEYGVWKLWQELRQNNKLSFIIRENGVGFIQKITK